MLGKCPGKTEEGTMCRRWMMGLVGAVHKYKREEKLEKKKLTQKLEAERNNKD